LQLVARGEHAFALEKVELDHAATAPLMTAIRRQKPSRTVQAKIDA
jgi:hypothetical protein